MSNNFLDFIKKVKMRGVILSSIMEDNKYNVIDYSMLSKQEHLELIRGIDFLFDNDVEFFLFERLFELSTSIKKICFEVINDYRFKYRENYDLCNSVIGKLNSLDYVSLVEKSDDIVNYYANEISSRANIFTDISLCLDAMFYDYYIYNSIINNDIDSIDYDDIVISTTNYFLNNAPEIYLDEKFYDNSMQLLNNAIKENHVFSRIKKSAKLTKNKLKDNKLRIHE